MELLHYYRLVRSTVPKGLHLCFAGRLVAEEDSTPGAEQTSEETSSDAVSREQVPSGEEHKVSAEKNPPVLTLTLRELYSDVDLPQESQERVRSFRPSSFSADGRFLFEVPTGDMHTGSYNTSLLYGGVQASDLKDDARQRLQLGGEIAVLDREQHRAVTGAIAAREFRPSPSLHYRDVAEYVRLVITERIEEDHFERQGVKRLGYQYQLTPQVRYIPIASSRVRWATEQLVDDFRQLALSGISRAFWHLSLGYNHFALGCRGYLLEPLTEGLVQTVTDADASFLSLLAQSEKLADRRPGIDKKVQIGSTRFSLSFALSLEAVTQENELFEPTALSIRPPQKDQVRVGR